MRWWTGSCSRCQSRLRSWFHSATLAELAAHEQELLAGQSPLVGVEQAQVGRLLPGVARHLAPQRALAVHALVVRQGQDEVLLELVDAAEGQLAVVVRAVDRIARHVLQGVVHPAHVPLVAEAEAADVGRPRHHRPRGRLLGVGLDPGVVAVGHLVERAEQLDRLEVLAPAVLVRDPLALAAAVVEVEHRRDPVDPEAVGVELLEPQRRARQEEALHLVAAVVEDRAGPVGVDALARVAVLVEVGAVELVGPVGVAREVRRHPVEDDPDAALVEDVDQVHQVLGPAHPRGRGEEAGDLVAPRAVERVLHHRHQLDVGEAEAGCVVGEQRRQLAVAERPVGVLGAAPPRPEVALVDRDRGVERAPRPRAPPSRPRRPTA